MIEAVLFCKVKVLFLSIKSGGFWESVDEYNGVSSMLKKNCLTARRSGENIQTDIELAFLLGCYNNFCCIFSSTFICSCARATTIYCRSHTDYGWEHHKTHFKQSKVSPLTYNHQQNYSVCLKGWDTVLCSVHREATGMMGRDYEGGMRGRQKERHGQVGRVYGPFFSGPVGTVGSGMGSKTLQSLPV